MEKNDKATKYLTLLALIIAVFAISFGFAAYTRAINISAISDVTVKNPVYNGGVLSVDSDKVTTGRVKPEVSGNIKAEEAILTKDTISNISAHFTKPGQKANYKFYGYNDSETKSYLNSVVFGSKVCKVSDGEMTEKVKKACDSIRMTIKVGSQTFTSTTVDMSNHEIDSKDSEVIDVKIEYLSSGIEADKNFKVDFGTSVLT